MILKYFLVPNITAGWFFQRELCHGCAEPFQWCKELQPSSWESYYGSSVFRWQSKPKKKSKMYASAVQLKCYCQHEVAAHAQAKV